jgi:hypothetical protein
MSHALIPASHLDLLTRAGVATLSTLSKDQSIQSSLVWFDYPDDDIRINVLDDSAQANNLLRHKGATLLVMDPGNVDRYLSIRCKWYGGAVVDNPSEAARRIIVCLKPVRVYSAE